MNGNGFRVTIEVPDIETMSDEQLAIVARMQDGRWSSQTKALLQKFEASKLDLNSGWASTWIEWSCPCCDRQKTQIARVSPGGVLTLPLGTAS